MADWHGITSNKDGGCSGRRSATRDEDFDEEQVVWSNYVNEKEDSSPTPTPRKPMRDQYSSSISSSSSSPSSSAWRLPSAPRMIRSHETKVAHQQQQSSAPVNIPDWSKIYGNGKHAYVESSNNNNNNNNRVNDVDDDNGHYYGGCGGEDEGDDMIPPHEWLARKLARSQISSFSVCEGMGRTLKGRDLSKVRNAVLTKTGFLE